jgi:uncharacterized protein DUF2568
VTVARHATLALKFVLELCMLAALAYWGAQAGGSTAGDVALGVGAPLVAAVVWGVYAAPRSARRLPRARRVVFESCVFALAAVALAAAGAPILAAVFAALVAVDTVLVLRWEAEERTCLGAPGDSGRAAG